MQTTYKGGTMVKCEGACGKSARVISHEPGPKTYICSPACAAIAADPVALRAARIERAAINARGTKVKGFVAGAGSKAGKKGH
jgi:hypothetical protein